MRAPVPRLVSLGLAGFQALEARAPHLVDPTDTTTADEKLVFAEGWARDAADLTYTWEVDLRDTYDAMVKEEEHVYASLGYGAPELIARSIFRGTEIDIVESRNPNDVPWTKVLVRAPAFDVGFLNEMLGATDDQRALFFTLSGSSRHT